jgi:ADP-heptose:LPS heptosyltransferase
VIVYGAFKGMGDLLNAAPVITRELDAGNTVKVLLFPGFSIESIVELIDFGPNRGNLELEYLPVSGRPGAIIRFLSKMSRIQPAWIWISPHCPRPVSSWRIPLLLWISKKLFWPKCKLAGAESERLSSLFDVRVPVDRNLPLAEREFRTFVSLGSSNVPPEPPRALFVESIRKRREEPSTVDLLIHPGANVANRRWPWDHFAHLVHLIPAKYRIAVLGVPADIDHARQALPEDRGIRFFSGTLEEAIAMIASARVLFSMDSGAAHFAACLNVPAVALFGKSDPASIVGYRGSVRPLYERKFPCQPCGKATCNQTEVFCMNSITPESVATQLLLLLGRSPSPPMQIRTNVQ